MRVMLGIPGRNIPDEALAAAKLASVSSEHEVQIVNARKPLAHQNFNLLWCAALNAADAGEIDLFVRHDADVFPEPGYLDFAIHELLRLELALLSTNICFKDERHLCSCGIGRFDYPWQAYRRLAVPEIQKLPLTFTKEDIGYPGPDYYLLHNTGCMIVNVRDFKWPDECVFSFPWKIVRGKAGRGCVFESEDWYFGRQAALAGLPTAITRGVRIFHDDYPNWIPGTWQCDEAMRPVWEGGQPQPLEANEGERLL